MISRIKTWLVWTFVAVVAVFGAYLSGHKGGARKRDDELARDTLDAKNKTIETRRTVDDQINASGPGDSRDQLLNDWVRDEDRH